MSSPGFQETQTKFDASVSPESLIGQFRRLGEFGPAYEVMDIDKEGNVVVEIVCSDERLTFPIAEILEDPIAKTLP